MTDRDLVQRLHDDLKQMAMGVELALAVLDGMPLPFPRSAARGEIARAAPPAALPAPARRKGGGEGKPRQPRRSQAGMHETPETEAPEAKPRDAQVRQLHALGRGAQAIGETIGVSAGTIYADLKRLGLAAPGRAA